MSLENISTNVDNCHLDDSNSFITISSNNSSISDESTNSESGCENARCVYCYNKTFIDTSFPVLIPLKNNKSTQGTIYSCNIIKADETFKTVVKISKQVDFVLENEIEAWNRLSIFNSPHFVKIHKSVPLAKHEKQIAVFFEKIHTGLQNGKSVSGAFKLSKTMKDSDKVSITFGDLLQDPNIHPSAILNCVRQTLTAVLMYESVGITHNDLHVDNIMIRNTPYDIHVYKINDTIIPIMTFGISPVIIDFGLAHIANSNWATTNVFLYQGISSFEKDPIIDCVLLLTSVKAHMEFHNSWIIAHHIEEMLAFYKYIKSVTEWFEPLQVDENGWYKQRIFPDTINDLLQMFPKIEYGIFSTKNMPYFIDLLQYAITVPIKKYESPKKKFKKSLLKLCVVWMETVEPVIKNVYREKVLVKDLIYLIAKNTSCFTGKTINIKPIFPDIIKYRRKYPSILNFYQLLSLLYNLRNAYSNKIYKVSTTVRNIKNSLYEQIVHKSTFEFLNNIPFVNYTVKPQMTVLIQDIDNSAQHHFTINCTQAKSINENPLIFNTIINEICIQQIKK